MTVKLFSVVKGGGGISSCYKLASATTLDSLKTFYFFS